MLQIAVAEQVNARNLDFLLGAVWEAIRMARPRFERAAIAYSEDEHLATVEQIARKLKS
jgi:hypothetical protein